MSSLSTRWLELGTRSLAFAVAAVSLAIIWTAFFTATQGERDRAVELQGDRLHHTGVAVSYALSHLLGDSRLSLELLVRQIAADPQDDALQSPEFLSLVQVVKNRNLTPLELNGGLVDGTLVPLGTSAPQPPVRVGDREFFLRQVPHPGAGFHIDAPWKNPETGAWSLVLSQPVPPHRGNLAVLLITLDFAQIDGLVDALVDPEVETVSLYQDDGRLLYQRPLASDPTGVSGFELLKEIRTYRSFTGILQGPELQSFHRLERTAAWLVVSRPQTALGSDWDHWFFGQLAWVSALSLVILGATALMMVLMARLRTIRLEQEKLARVDPLTGLLNRRAFLERCALEQTRALRSPGSLGLILLDLDHFKAINDRFGHHEGDRVLKALAGLLVRTIRTSDATARIGGEEFAVLLTASEPAAVQETAERLRAAVETIALPEGFLTTSLGVAIWNREESFDAWYQRGDLALYRAKTRGRNRVEAAS